MANLRSPSEAHRTGGPNSVEVRAGGPSRRSRTASRALVVAALAVALLALTPTNVSAGTADPIPGAGRAIPMGIGDVDGDGRQEAALIIPGRSTVVTIDVMTLDHEIRQVAGSGGPIGDGRPVGVADIDGDGRDDLVTTRSGGTDIWYRGLRNGTFGRGVVLGTGDDTGAVKAVGSLDGFAVADIMASLAPPVGSQPLRYRGLAGELVSIDTDTGAAGFMVAGRFETDDREQLRVLVAIGNRRTSFVGFRKEGTSVTGFVLSEISWTLSQTRSVVPADVDGDGLDDLVVQRTDGTLWIFTNDGAGDFETIRRVTTADDLLTDSTVVVGATDINGDGLDDVVAINGSTPFRLWGHATDLLVPERPATPVRRCAGRSVTVEIAFGEQPTDGDDVVLGTPGDDVIDALGGNDVVCALGGNDIVRGGRGNDIVIGGRGNDILIGGGGNDELLGGPGRDRLRGGPGNDRLVGGRGPDRLVGGPGDNTCIGGPGRDRLLRGC
jgi:Ca2+-binding RTX toxin-like protein